VNLDAAGEAGQSPAREFMREALFTDESPLVAPLSNITCQESHIGHDPEKREPVFGKDHAPTLS